MYSKNSANKPSQHQCTEMNREINEINCVPSNSAICGVKANTQDLHIQKQMKNLSHHHDHINLAYKGNPDGRDVQTRMADQVKHAIRANTMKLQSIISGCIVFPYPALFLRTPDEKMNRGFTVSCLSCTYCYFQFSKS